MHFVKVSPVSQTAHQFLDIFLSNQLWFTTHLFLLLCKVDVNNSFFTCFLKVPISSSSFFWNNRLTCSANFISFLKSPRWKLCTCFSKNYFFWEFQSSGNSQWSLFRNSFVNHYSEFWSPYLFQKSFYKFVQQTSQWFGPPSFYLYYSSAAVKRTV